MFEKLFKKFEPKRELSVTKIGKKFFLLENGILENLEFSLQGTYKYEDVVKLNEISGYSARFGFVPNLGPVAIIGIPNPDYKLKYFQDIWEYGKFSPIEYFEFQSYENEQENKIANYIVYGCSCIEKLADVVKFDKVNFHHDSRYKIKHSNKYRIFNMDCRLKGKYSYQLALDIVEHEDFKLQGNTILFARVGKRNVGIIGMWKESIANVAGFRDVWEYGEKEPKVEMITFFDDEQAKNNTDYTLYYYDYVLPDSYKRNYYIEALDRTISTKFNFYDSQIKKDFRLSEIEDLYREKEKIGGEKQFAGYYVKKELNTYIIQNILPEYEKFDKGHDIKHVIEVIFRSFKIISKLSDLHDIIDCNIVYTVAAYHDFGIKINRKNHAHYSGIFVRQDNKLKEFFTDDEIEIIAQAVEDHSTSLNKEPRNIYGKIVSDADKDDDYIEGLRRAYEYTKVYYPEFTYEQARDNCFEQLNKKFGKEGLVCYYVLDENNSEFVKMMKKMAGDKELFEKIFKEAIKEAIIN